MVKEIRLYVEGGGEKKETKALIRNGLSIFLKEMVQMARNKGISWNITICGSRNNAFRDFNNALSAYPDAFIILLVDSEAPVRQSPWKHLKSRDNWEPPDVDDTHCHLMVQTMEAWLVADIDTLKKFYGQGFKENSIPKNPNVEQIDKDLLSSSLETATRNTSKGEYHKINHASKLLAELDVAKVRKASRHCDRLFTTLITIMYTL